MGLQNVFKTARLWGDASSVSRGFAPVGKRAGVRVLGRASGGAMAGQGVANLFIFAYFMDFLRDAVKQANARDVYIVNAMRYSKGYDTGFITIAAGRRLPPPGYRFFQDGIEEAVSGQGRRRASLQKGGLNRSGLYIGGRFTADIRAIMGGSLLARLSRRSAGRASTAFFWGTLRDPTRNPLEGIAKNAVRAIRRNIRKHNLRDTYAMGMATQWDTTLNDALQKSRSEAIRKLVAGGQSKMNVIARKVG